MCCSKISTQFILLVTSYDMEAEAMKNLSLSHPRIQVPRLSTFNTPLETNIPSYQSKRIMRTDHPGPFKSAEILHLFNISNHFFHNE